MKRKLKFLGSLLITVCLLTACTALALPEGFEEEAVSDRAEYVVEQLSVQDYEGVAAIFSPEMSAVLDAAGLETALGSTIEALGTYEGVTSTSMMGGSSESAGAYAVAILVCKYQNGQAIYTISIDQNNMVCGLYMK